MDIEATGMNIPSDRIVELAILKVLPKGEVQTTTYRFNPEMAIPEEVSAIHGIYDDDVKDAPLFSDKADEIFDLLKGADIGGFNSNRFDIPMLVEEFLRCEIVFDISQRKLIDVYRIFTHMEKT